jgi:hypothetical protein
MKLALGRPMVSLALMLTGFPNDDIAQSSKEPSVPGANGRTRQGGCGHQKVTTCLSET